MAIEWIDAVFGQRSPLKCFDAGGTQLTPPESALQIAGAGVSWSVDLVNNRYVLNVPGFTASLSSGAPPAIAAAGVRGALSTIAREDHTHAHGAQTDGTMHAAVVSGGTNGFMLGTDKAILDTATSAATASAVCRRDGSGNCSFAAITATTASISALQSTVATLPIKDSTGATTINVGLANAGACSIAPVASCTSFLIQQTQATAGAGVDLTIGGSLGHTPGTNLSGNTNIELGLPDGTSNSALVNFKSNGVAQGRIGLLHGGYFTLDCPTGAGPYISNANNSLILSTVTQFIGANYITFNYSAFQVLDPSTAAPFFEYQHIAASSRVISLCRNAVISATNMPANSGDGVVNVANAIAVPTANPDNTGTVLFGASGANSSRLCARDHLGVVTDLSYSNSGGGTTASGTYAIMHRTGRLTYAATGTSGAILSIPAAEFPTAAKFVAFCKFRVVGYDTTKAGTAAHYAAEYQAYVVCGGAGLVVVTDMTTVGTVLNGTGQTNTFHVTVPSNVLTVAVTTTAGDSIDWTVFAEISFASN